MTEIRNIKELLSKHLPHVYSIIKDDSRIWNKLQTKFEVKLTGINSEVIIENSIPILLGRAELNDQISIDFLKFVDKTINSLKGKIPAELNSLFRKMIGTMIQEFDKKTLDKLTPNYLNWFAEFLAINKILENGTYQLVNFETKQSNDRPMDFELKDDKGKTILIDVFSKHIPNEKAENQELLTLYLNRELDNKFNYKTENLTSKDGRYILPVFWFDDEIKDNILVYLKTANLNERNIIDPSVLVQNKLEENTEFIFGTILSLYK